jgi:hypothetical protein
MRANPLVIFDFPGGDSSITVLICEELAHAFLFASRDPTHVPDIGDHDQAEKRACDVMKGWGCDMQEHERLIEWVKGQCKNGAWKPLPWR